MPTPIEANRISWDQKARTHLQGTHPVYPIADFVAGKTGFAPNTPDDLGPVGGKKLLHLQCHFGMDTLMWARNGAIVTGVDFSPVAINAARDLAMKCDLHATFIESDIATLANHPDAPAGGSFDIIVNYYGVLPWLPDLMAWAKTIAHFLKPGGFFYLADTHPVLHTFDIPAGGHTPVQFMPYFQTAPTRYEFTGTYAAPKADTGTLVCYEWQHTLATIINSLLAAGLRLDYLHEFPYSFYNLYYATAPDFLERKPGTPWRPHKIPTTSR